MNLITPSLSPYVPTDETAKSPSGSIGLHLALVRLCDSLGSETGIGLQVVSKSISAQAPLSKTKEDVDDIAEIDVMALFVGVNSPIALAHEIRVGETAFLALLGPALRAISSARPGRRD